MSAAAFENVANGMSYDEVCAMLGEPTRLLDQANANIEPGLTLNALNTQLFEWEMESTVYRVLFTNGTVNDKSHFEIEPE